jgi:hypothetical protein
MIRRFFRIRHWRARARFWQRKYQAARAEIRFLRAELNAEMNRNREREDTFVSATVMGTRNMFGVAPRSAPALAKSVGQSSTSGKPFDPQWDGLSWPDKAEFETSWMPLARAQGYSEAQARQHFLAELANRRTLNDDGASN